MSDITELEKAVDEFAEAMKPLRLPRTLNEAFGPYTSHEIHDPDKDSRAMRVHIIATIIVSAVLLFVVYLIKK